MHAYPEASSSSRCEIDCLEVPLVVNGSRVGPGHGSQPVVDHRVHVESVDVGSVHVVPEPYALGVGSWGDQRTEKLGCVIDSSWGGCLDE